MSPILFLDVCITPLIIICPCTLFFRVLYTLLLSSSCISPASPSLLFFICLIFILHLLHPRSSSSSSLPPPPLPFLTYLFRCISLCQLIAYLKKNFLESMIFIFLL
uniref:Uncharacterized protein n=1 Tax=Cacopsylla melanoneura TaxID=428564 RepID=A0A8D8VA21_9HEMI